MSFAVVVKKRKKALKTLVKILGKRKALYYWGIKLNKYRRKSIIIKWK